MKSAAKKSAEPEVEQVYPQAGFQWRALSSPADVIICGGSAFCGKSFALLMGAARHCHVQGYGATLFRATRPEITDEGGLWDTSMKLYPGMGASPRIGTLDWFWGRRERPVSKVKMTYLGDDSIAGKQGSQIPFIGLDELTGFSERVFWMIQGRNRSACGVNPYLMATCNPDADSWVAQLIDWYIDQDESSETYGLPLPERADVVRYLTRDDDTIVWGDSREEVAAKTGKNPRDIVSFAFVPGTIDDNVIGNRIDPKYRAKLEMLPRVDRLRLLYGNWKVRVVAGDFFPRADLTFLDEAPKVVKVVRRWDLAASRPRPDYPDPDWTYGVKIGVTEKGRFVILDAIGMRERSSDVEDQILRTASADGKRCTVVLPQDPGQAGLSQVNDMVKKLRGFIIGIDKESGPKEARAKPFSSQWVHHNVDIVRGHWNDQYLAQMEAFPSKNVHDDAPDASAGAFNYLVNATPLMGVNW